MPGRSPRLPSAAFLFMGNVCAAIVFLLSLWGLLWAIVPQGGLRGWDGAERPSSQQVHETAERMRRGAEQGSFRRQRRQPPAR